MHDAPVLYLLSGLMASGKTTKALAWEAEDPEWRRRISWDELRISLYGPNWHFNRDAERAMKSHGRKIARQWLLEGRSVVIDNTNLTDRTKESWRNLAREMAVECLEEELHTPIRVCVERDRKRDPDKRVGRAVIERWALETGWIDWSLYTSRRFIIVDVDGTLANTDHREHFVSGETIHLTECQDLVPFKNGTCTHCGVRQFKKDWRSFFANVHLDEPIRPIFKLVKLLEEDFWVITVSGRPIDPCGIPTEDWLLKYDLDPLFLFMRASHDKGPDSEAKQAILDYLPKDRIAYVLDDRNSVVEMWRRNGLTCLQCANGDF